MPSFLVKEPTGQYHVFSTVVMGVTAGPMGPEEAIQYIIDNGWGTRRGSTPIGYPLPPNAIVSEPRTVVASKTAPDWVPGLTYTYVDFTTPPLSIAEAGQFLLDFALVQGTEHWAYNTGGSYDTN